MILKERPSLMDGLFDAHNGVPSRLLYWYENEIWMLRREDHIVVPMMMSTVALESILVGVAGMTYPTMCNKIAYVVRETENGITVAWSYDDRVLAMAVYREDGVDRVLTEKERIIRDVRNRQS